MGSLAEQAVLTGMFTLIFQLTHWVQYRCRTLRPVPVLYQESGHQVGGDYHQLECSVAGSFATAPDQQTRQDVL